MKNKKTFGADGKEIKYGTIKIKRCKLTGKRVKMLYEGDEDSENGENGHIGWLCLHKGGMK